MRDEGLQEAIRAVGGVSELARRLGISQPSVSNWDRIPAERVLSVEAATGVARDRAATGPLQRRAMNGVSTRSMPRAPRNTRCSRRCWRAVPTPSFSDAWRSLRGDASPLGVAHAALGEAAARADAERVGREYFDLFIGLGRGELLPYASYYLTGFLYERPLARLRGDLKRLGIEQSRRTIGARGSRRDPLRDHGRDSPAATIAAPAGADREIFEKHMAPWMRTLLRRPGAFQDGGLLRPRRRARPDVRGNRNGGLRAPAVAGAEAVEEEATMKAQDKAKVGRRDFLRVLGAGAGVPLRHRRARQRAPTPTAKPTTRSASRATAKPST